MAGKKFVRVLIAVFFSSTCMNTVHGQELNLLGDLRPPQQSSEYIYRSLPKESLVSVQLLGAVNKPGVYYVPLNTDLLKLITLAGGSTNGGDLSGVLVRKVEPKTWLEYKSKAVNEYQGAYEVDAEKLIKFGGSKNLKLQQDDFVYIPPKSQWITPETSRNITFISLAFGIVLTSLLIERNAEKRQ